MAHLHECSPKDLDSIKKALSAQLKDVDNLCAESLQTQLHISASNMDSLAQLRQENKISTEQFVQASIQYLKVSLTLVSRMES